MTNGTGKGLLGLGLLIGAGVICPLLAARYIPLVDPDEGLHAAIAQKMVESGNWLVPSILDEPFLDKPILYFWAIAASLKTFGMSEAAVRLPGLLFGMLGTVTTAAIAWRMLGRRVGLIAGLFYATMALPLALVQLPVHDVALVPLVNLALLCFWEADRAFVERNLFPSKHPRERNEFRSTNWTVAAGAALGLGILTKGLAGVALAGIAYGGYLVVSRRLRFVHCFRALVALSVAALIGSSWYLAVEQSRPGFLHYYFFDRHVLGFLTRDQPHGAAQWWYYLPILIVGGLPWGAYLPVLVCDAYSRQRVKTPVASDAGDNRPLLFLGCWLVGCTLFLTMAGSKFGTYIWPVFPAVAILAAVVWARKIEGSLSPAARRWMTPIICLTGLLGLLGMPATFAVTQIAMPMRFSSAAWALGIAAATTSLLPLWTWFRGQDRWTLALAATAIYVQLAVMLFCALSPVAAGLSGRDLAEYLNRTRQLPSRLFFAQERLGSVVFYLDPDLRRGLQPGQMLNLDIDDPLPRPPVGIQEWIVISERHLHTALEDYDLSPLPYERRAVSHLPAERHRAAHSGRPGRQPDDAMKLLSPSRREAVVGWDKVARNWWAVANRPTVDSGVNEELAIDRDRRPTTRSVCLSHPTASNWWAVANRPTVDSGVNEELAIDRDRRPTTRSVCLSHPTATAPPRALARPCNPSCRCPGRELLPRAGPHRAASRRGAPSGREWRWPARAKDRPS